MRDKFERKTFKLLIGGSTASTACSMQGDKNDITAIKVHSHGRGVREHNGGGGTTFYIAAESNNGGSGH